MRLPSHQRAAFLFGGMDSLFVSSCRFGDRLALSRRDEIFSMTMPPEKPGVHHQPAVAVLAWFVRRQPSLSYEAANLHEARRSGSGSRDEYDRPVRPLACFGVSAIARNRLSRLRRPPPSIPTLHAPAGRCARVFSAADARTRSAVSGAWRNRFGREGSGPPPPSAPATA